jgi:hypothetical protein
MQKQFFEYLDCHPRTGMLAAVNLADAGQAAG